MDAKRYQQIQDLFWETESLPRDEHDAFLRTRVPGDEELIREVLSLLDEHDPQAAEIEGRSATPLPLPDTSKTSDRDDAVRTEAFPETSPKPASSTTKKGSSSDRPGNRPGNRPGETVGGAQRTHAAPRHPKAPRRTKHQTANQPPSSTLPTSVGPPRLKWSWLPLWVFLVFSGVVPIWIVAASIGNSRLETEKQMRDRLLPLSLDQARWRLASLLDEERRLSERLASNDRIVQLVQEDATQDETRDETQANPKSLENWLSGRATTDETIAVWDREFRLVANTSKQTPIKQAWTTRYAGALAQTLQGESVFIGPTDLANRQHASETSRSDHPSLDTGVGWMVPVRAENSTPDSDETPIGALMRTRDVLWPRVARELARLSDANELDVYLVDSQGFLQAPLRLPATSIDEESTRRETTPFRVAEYRAGEEGNAANTIPPLTIAVASVIAAPRVVVCSDPYASYSGGHCVGAWVWLPDYDLGLIVETPVQRNGTGLSLTWPWAMLASLLVAATASAVTWWHQSKVTSLLDSRQPLGRYEISSELGSGGMGVVYLARHKELGRSIALKVLRSDRQDEDDRQRFDREARLAASLSCPHNVTVFDFGYTAEGNAYCVMELLEGLTLAEVVARGGSQPPGRVVWILQQICQAMLEAHGKGLMHRDLKPQNVMLRFDGVLGDWATVFDFGLAKPIEPDADAFQTSETIWAGTPMYMAPERFRDPSSMDPRSDIYSIGCIAYYLLAGNPPFAECDPESMFVLIMSEQPIEIATHRNDPIDPRLDQWVRDCMCKDKNSRASNLEKLMESLRGIAADNPWSRSDAESWWTTHAKERIS